jgi:hypothetical protein
MIPCSPDGNCAHETHDTILDRTDVHTPLRIFDISFVCFMQEEGRLIYITPKEAKKRTIQLSYLVFVSFFFFFGGKMGVFGTVVY